MYDTFMCVCAFGVASGAGAGAGSVVVIVDWLRAAGLRSTGRDRPRALVVGADLPRASTTPMDQARRRPGARARRWLGARSGCTSR
jgi:hypothetical protein